MSRSFTATGDIAVSRFVALDSSADYAVAQCGANGRAIGVSQMGGYIHPLLDTSDPPLAAKDGMQLQVIQPDDPNGGGALVEYGGTITAGAPLKSDADGKAVAATLVSGIVGPGQIIVARALESGTAGTKGFVKLLTFETATDPD